MLVSRGYSKMVETYEFAYHPFGKQRINLKASWANIEMNEFKAYDTKRKRKGKFNLADWKFQDLGSMELPNCIYLR